MSKSRVFLLMLLCFLAGVFVTSFLNFSFWFFIILFLISAVLLVAAIQRQEKKVIIIALLFFSFLVGIARAEYSARATPDLSNIFGRQETFRGVVWSIPERNNTSVRFLARVKKENDTGSPYFLMRVTTKAYPEYSVGESLILNGVLEDPSQSRYGKTARDAVEGVSATMLFPKIETDVFSNESSLYTTLDQIRRSFEKRVELVLSEPYAGLLEGLLLGKRSTLPASLLDDLRITGTTHIIALSGYNITLVGGVVMTFFLWFGLSFRRSFWCASIFIILFVLMTGASASVVRAGIMGVLMLFARDQGRSYRMENALTLAAAVMVWQKPFILAFDVAFQLSFAAALGIFYLAPVIEQFFDRVKFFFKKNGNKPLDRYGFERERVFSGHSVLAETLGAQITVLPLILYYFKVFSVISPLANIAILMAVPWAMGTGFFAAILSFISGFLGRIFSIIPWIFLEYIIRAEDFFARVPWASFATIPINWVGIIIFYGIIIMIFFMFTRKKRHEFS